MMKQNNIDQQLVEALNFSNLALLDQCFRQINYTILGRNQITMKVQKEHTKSKFEKQPTKSKFEKEPTKSKFEKVTNVKNKPKNINSPNQFQNITIASNLKPANTQHFTHSKVKIYSTELDPFQLSNFNNNSSLLYNSPQTDSYTINDFLKQTATSTSKNKHSPINAWKSSSVEKYQPNLYNNLQTQNHYTNQHNPINSFQYSQQNQKGSVGSTYKQKATFNTNQMPKKVKSKFQKSKSSTKVTKNIPESDKHQDKKPQQLKSIYDPQENQIKIDIQPIHPKNKNDSYYSSTSQNKPQEKRIQQESYKMDFNDVETRDTCELAPSKLQKLIEVEDNKYKEIVLKTFYKHQK